MSAFRFDTTTFDTTLWVYPGLHPGEGANDQVLLRLLHPCELLRLSTRPECCAPISHRGGDVRSRSVIDFQALMAFRRTGRCKSVGWKIRHPSFPGSSFQALLIPT